MEQRLISPLQGWKAEPEPDGSARLSPVAKPEPGGGWTLLSSGLTLWAFCGFLLFAIHLGVLRYGPDRVMIAVCAVLFPMGGLLVRQGLWKLFGREEWRAGPDRLEVQQSSFGFRRLRRYRGAVLELVYSPADSWEERGRGLPIYRESQLTRAQAAADPHTWWGLFVVAGDRRRCLYSTSRQPLTMEELRDLGDFIAAQTGWPLHVRKG